MIVYLARYLLPVSSPPVADGAVAIDGDRIAAAGPREQVLGQVGDSAETRDLGDAAIFPGLINAHTHLELSWLGESRPAGSNYIAWVRDLLPRLAERDSPEAQAAAQQQIDTLLARGTVAVGDVGNADWIVPLLARSALHGIAFREVLGFASDQAEQQLEQVAASMERLAEDSDVRSATGRLEVMPTPHGPHTTSGALLRALAGRAAATHQSMSIHLAESAEEDRLLRHGDGEMADLLRERGGWDDAWEAPGTSPVEYLHHIGTLSERTLAVHAVQLEAQDHSLLQASGVTVVTCPRSNDYLGVGTAPVPQLMREGVPVAIGTDSLASAPDLDMLGEIAALRRIHPEVAPAAALRMATLNGARALRIDDRLGTIEAGKLARINAVTLPDGDADPLEVLCSMPAHVQPLGAEEPRE